MIKLLRKLATAMLPALLCGTLFIGCEADDKYTKVDDLFQPRFVLEKPEVKANSVTLVWYKVDVYKRQDGPLRICIDAI